MRRFLTPLCFALMAIIFVSGATPASAVTRKKARELREEEKKKEKNPEQTEFIERQGTAINFFLQVGKLIGDVAGDIDRYNGELNNKITAGFGGALETPLTDKLYLGGSFEMDWNWPHKDAGNVNLMTIAARSRWLFTPLKRKTFYLSAGLGLAFGSYNGDYNIDDDLGSHPSLYLSLGRQMRFGSRSINSFEFYYRTIFSKDAEIDASIFHTVPYNVSTIGFRMIFGLEL